MTMACPKWIHVLLSTRKKLYTCDLFAPLIPLLEREILDYLNLKREFGLHFNVFISLLLNRLHVMNTIYQLKFKHNTKMRIIFIHFIFGFVIIFSLK